MPTDARTLSLIQDVKDLQRQARRQSSRNVGGTPIWEFDTYTITGSGDTTHTLSWLPYGINVVLLNGLGLVEGVEYSCDYTTGVVTVTATLTAGDVLHVRYVTTGDLMVFSGPADFGTQAPTLVNSASHHASYAGDGSVNSTFCPVPTGTAVGDRLLLQVTGANTIASTPAGWTLVETGDNNESQVRILTRVADGTEGTSVTIALTNRLGGSTQDRSSIMRAYRGLSGTPPVLTHATTTVIALTCTAGQPSYTGPVVAVYGWGEYQAFSTSAVVQPSGVGNWVADGVGVISAGTGDESLTLSGTAPARNTTTVSGGTAKWCGTTVLLGWA